MAAFSFTRAGAIRMRSAGASATGEARWVRLLLGGTAVAFLTLFLMVPLAAVFVNALAKGAGAFAAAIGDPDALSSIRLTLLTAMIAVPLNVVFGIAAAWLIAKFEFRGKSILASLVDVPFAVSPVISGMIFVLLFGAEGWFGHWLASHNLRIIFALPGIVLATLFVTFPAVARELIPVMQASGKEEEEAALVLGASGWQMFRRVTLPNVKWGLLYGVIICNARAMGEFGAVSVVSGRIRGLTATMPIYVQLLYDGYDFAGAFAISSILTSLALLTIIAKRVLTPTSPAARAETSGIRADQKIAA